MAKTLRRLDSTHNREQGHRWLMLELGAVLCDDADYFDDVVV
jgi:hypothetical protein